MVGRSLQSNDMLPPGATPSLRDFPCVLPRFSSNCKIFTDKSSVTGCFNLVFMFLMSGVWARSA